MPAEFTARLASLCAEPSADRPGTRLTFGSLSKSSTFARLPIDANGAHEGIYMKTQKIQVAIRASRAEVWRALVDPTVSPAYYYGFEAHYDLLPGSSYSYTSDGREVISGVLLEAIEEARLRMTFIGTWAPDVADLPPSEITYEIGEAAMAIPGITSLTLTHEGLPDTDAARNVEKGWVLILSGLKTLLETGKPLIPAPAG